MQQIREQKQVSQIYILFYPVKNPVSPVLGSHFFREPLQGFPPIAISTRSKAD